MSGAGRTNYRARYACGPEDLRRARALRGRRFRPGRGPDAFDADAFDERARHVLVEDDGGRLVCTFRLLRFPSGAQIAGSYSAQFYGLERLAAFPGPMLELGRFCVESATPDASILRVAWGALGAEVEAQGTRLIFGCSSFAGAEAAPYADAFALLGQRHLAPRRWSPRVKAPLVFRFGGRRRAPDPPPDPPTAMRALPPLLRTYLAMGGWVSDHAVVDRDLGTLHVFTGLEIDTVPEARVRALRAHREAPKCER